VIAESSVLEAQRRDELVLGVAEMLLAEAIEAAALRSHRAGDALVSSGLSERSERLRGTHGSADGGRSERNEVLVEASAGV